MLYNILVTNILLLSVAVCSKITFGFFHPDLRELLLSQQGWYAVLWGIRMDLAAVAVLATLCLLVDLVYGCFRDKNNFVGKLMLGLAACWIIVTTAADFMYFSESGRHVTFEVFTAQGSEVGLFLTALINYKAECLATVVLVVISLRVLRRVRFNPVYSGAKYRAVGVFVLLWPVLAVSAVRGGWSDAPQSPMSAYKIGSSHLAKLAWSAPYSIAYHLLKGQEEAAKKITPDLGSERLVGVAGALAEGRAPSLPRLKPANVVIVLLESWAAVDLQSYAGQVDAAPFFDELRQAALTTKATYANGFRTVEGMFATFCSYPNPVGGGVAGTQLQNGAYRCLPHILRDQGWETSFIQGSGKGIVGAFAQTLGFTHSFGKKDYLFEGEKNYWGYMDDGIYRFALGKMLAAKTPFLITINTGTTHDRYLPRPEDYVFGDDTQEQIRRSVQRHADQSLRRFISELKSNIQEPTLVVLVSDHTANVGDVGLARNAIPFLMFAINDDLVPAERDIVSSQRDIAPTIVDWLGGDIPWFSGRSLLDAGYQGFADFSDGETVKVVDGERLIEINARTAQLNACYSLAADMLTTNREDCGAQERKRFERAKNYLLYSQQLLFDGNTLGFRHAAAFAGGQDWSAARANALIAPGS